MMRSRSWRLGAVLGAVAIAPAALANHPSQEILGLFLLQARLGEDTPTGAGVVAATVETFPIGTDDYLPDTSLPNFAGKTFTIESGPSDPSVHATQVAKFQYGVRRSVAPGVTDILLYLAEHWALTGYLHTTAGTEITPETPPPGGIKVLNNSWIASFGNVEYDNDALRRADWVAQHDNVIITSGVPNEPPNTVLLSHMYNGIAVGSRYGGHIADNTLPAYDGPGRMKPEIVGPDVYTSFATPMVNATASVLIETARTVLENPNGERSDVIKAVLLASAVHENLLTGTWTNAPVTSGPTRGVTSTPIDAVMGAGTVHVDRAHLLLTGGEQDGDELPPTAITAGPRGWDATSVAIGGGRYWRFELTEPADEVSVVATWHRDVRGDFGLFTDGWTVADLDLVLWRVDEQGNLASLVGNPGLSYFGGGNVVSESAVDNVEHLYVTNLAAGEYVIQLDRIDALPFSNDWEAAVAWTMPEPVLPPEDLNDDGFVDFADLLQLIGAWGDCIGCVEDINNDGEVSFAEILLIIGAWS